MIEGRCESCVHWRPFDDEEYAGFESLRVRRNRLGLCAKLGNEKDRVDPAEDEWTILEPMLPEDGTLAMADDASGMQKMRTAASFGCVLWEKKP